ncbi:UDP-N-acetylmuramoyl-L-alanyl-D-glutamate--2,6-diaminopimelate ligase [Streptomyces sp. H10-C2]|uniref:UDP-N-acetylmuramoyl-L-alanyl-D-glutamate--2, 6-diaminopimelate ligase n=1 Tax=unclassified Streptomyces TaxID=2593676 RepID=UPI0024BB63A3|nr:MULTISPECIES: UDP-N-acetylmuramoyl-L-alanyl-D-glutamate--2,6-diaminopimelate ligase [unclassified Streptomyces]MDJ0341085.1 UDP-N-acetylmuramoyl-L-alanyl-D-glutamate--2,6-diaminopimelate ligase [Streptomyces sp. PH10-H1]MDJ0369564.1 UDP-N-acetylmuramoyl-L-alanyl-D-glutamate--2,6-diaminopimelate ligase [Streptomyces sp. H10-C2]
MTTITSDGDRPVRDRGPFGPDPGQPGNLTAVPKADQSSLKQPGAPRPSHVRPKALAELAAHLGAALPADGAPATGITHDSRAVRPGDVYAALPGARFHGADFAAQAADLGAVAILTDLAGSARAAATGLPVLTVDDPRSRMGALAAAIYDDPGRDLLQIGITGTSGKTTTAYLVEGGLRAHEEQRAALSAKGGDGRREGGRATGLIGTVESRIGDERIKSERTTPEATDLQALFALMRERGVRSVVMEVSSHALVLGRVDGAVFDVAVFNNLSPEHMEFHTGMEDYFQAKARLFTPQRSRVGVVNLDDAYGRRLVAEAGVPVTTFSAEGNPDADWRAVDVATGPLGSTFTVLGPKGETARAAAPLPGPFNVANTLAAITALVIAGIDPQTAADGVAAVPGVPGRLEGVDAGQPYLAVVDYAHKTDAVESVLRALRKTTEGRIHAVLGCGGDRDQHKRGPMGAACARLADTAVLTSDNPRSEDPLAILAAMLNGAAEVPAFERGHVIVEPDRAAAIAIAVARAQPGDIVLVAGKGHEQGQDIAGVVRPFDDREVLRAAIEKDQEQL